MDWNPPDTWKKLAGWLAELPQSLDARPKAIVVISGHWEEPEFTVTAHPRPPLIYDYYGFPEHTYRLKYDAPGSPELAQKIRDLLEQSGIPAQSDASRGFDHGVFIPFKVIFPDADIPVVQLSLKTGLDPEAHIKAGRALAPLRNEGVLIAGSGMSYHNMSRFGAVADPASDRFDAWLSEAVTARDPGARDQRLAQWERAPAARQAHPREEHLLPLMVAAGAADSDPGEKVFTDRVMGATISAFRFARAK